MLVSTLCTENDLGHIDIGTYVHLTPAGKLGWSDMALIMGSSDLRMMAAYLLAHRRRDLISRVCRFYRWQTLSPDILVEKNFLRDENLIKKIFEDVPFTVDQSDHDFWLKFAAANAERLLRASLKGADFLVFLHLDEKTYLNRFRRRSFNEASNDEVMARFRTQTSCMKEIFMRGQEDPRCISLNIDDNAAAAHLLTRIVTDRASHKATVRA